MLKFLLFIMYGTAVFFLPNSPWILTLIIINLGALVVARIFAHAKLRKIFFGVLKFLPFIVLAFIFNYWLDSLQNALWISYKLLIVCHMTMVYASTTSNLEVATTVQKICAPLRLFRIDTEDIKILVCISLSLIPTLRQQLIELRLACSAKGITLNLRNSKIILTRFLTAVFMRIEQIEASLLSKGYHEP